MDIQTIAHYTGLSEAQVAGYLSRPAAETYRDPHYIQLLESLDNKYLRQTLGMVRDYYDEHLGEFVDELENRYQISRGAMSGFTLANWVIGFLDYPDYAVDLLERHSKLPAEVFDGGLEDLLLLLEGLPEGREQWQQALCLLAFPLMAK